MCPKCNSKEFIVQTTVIMVRQYKILKNGKAWSKPLNIEEHFDMNDNFDNTVICKSCNSEYAIKGMGYKNMLKSNYNDIDLSTRGIEFVK